MNQTKKALRGAIIAFVLCGWAGDISGDPFTMYINGTMGGVITFFLLLWIFSRPAAASWSTRRQMGYTIAISVFAALIMGVTAYIRLLEFERDHERDQVTSITLRETNGAITSFHGTYITKGLTNNVSGILPANIALSKDVHSIRYEFFCDQKEPREIELTIAVAFGGSSSKNWKKHVSGQFSFIEHEDGSSEFRDEPDLSPTAYSDEQLKP